MPDIGNAAAQAATAILSIVNPPVSSTVYQNTYAKGIRVFGSVTLAYSTTATVSMVASISSDGTTWTEVGRASVPANIYATTLGSITLPISFYVPAGWRYRLVASSGATMGTFSSVG